MAAGINLPVARRLVLWFPVAGWMAFIFYTSSLSGNNIPSFFAFQDVVYHALVYGVLGLCVSRALKGTHHGISPVMLVGAACVFGFLYGLSDEWHQSFVPGRHVSGMDIAVDGIGSFLGGLLYQWLR